MDHPAFDRIARLLGGAANRRSAIGALFGAATGLSTAVAETEAREKRRRARRPGIEGPCGDGTRKANICTKDSECCTGICNTKTGKRNKDRKGRCRCIRNGKVCTENRNCCNADCVNGICGKGATCGSAGQSCTPQETCCAGLICTNGICATGIPTGDACVEGVDFCADSLATCTRYLERDPEGTYCLLPLNKACGGNGECESANCGGGICALAVCDVCTSGCLYSDLDQALLAAPDNAIVRVDAGTWTTTNGESSTPGGGRIRDGRHLTVRACNGVSGVNVTSTQSWSVFYIEVPDHGGWTLEGLNIYGGATKSGPWIYITGASASEISTLTMRNCTVTNDANSETIGSYVELYAYTSMTATDTTFTKGSGNYGASYFGILGSGVAASTQPSEIILERVTIQDVGRNAASTGALDLAYYNATLTDCTISNNTGKNNRAGGGISLNSTDGPVNLTLAGTTTITGNTATAATGAGGINANTKVGLDHTITIASTASVTGNTGTAAGGIGHRYQFNETHGVLTVTGGDRVTGNTSTDQCANIPTSTSPVAVPGCVWP